MYNGCIETGWPSASMSRACCEREQAGAWPVVHGSIGMHGRRGACWGRGAIHLLVQVRPVLAAPARPFPGHTGRLTARARSAPSHGVLIPRRLPVRPWCDAADGGCPVPGCGLAALETCCSLPSPVCRRDEERSWPDTARLPGPAAASTSRTDRHCAPPPRAACHVEAVQNKGQQASQPASQPLVQPRVAARLPCDRAWPRRLVSHGPGADRRCPELATDRRREAGGGQRRLGQRGVVASAPPQPGLATLRLSRC